MLGKLTATPTLYLETFMSRPSFRLDNEQARQLIGHMHRLEERYPLDRRDHRPFVRDFLRAVYDATGQVYGAATYRKLLAAYAPERRPSTTTLAAEKELLVQSLERERAGSAELATSAAPELAELIRLAVTDAMDRAPAARLAIETRIPAHSGENAATAIWKERAIELEKMLNLANHLAGRQAAELEGGQQTTATLREELKQARDVLAAQTAQLARLAATIEDARLLYLRAVDDARGETRVWRKRYASVEAAAKAKAKEDQLLLETFRQMAYQRGGEIPPGLRKDLG